MKKLLSLLLALCILLPAAALADPEVTVHGSATVKLEADSVSVNIGVRTFETDVAAAMSGNAAAVEKVRNALTDAGASQIITASFYVDTIYDYSAPAPVLSGYQVTHTLSVVLNDITKLGGMLDTAAAAGANEIYNINFCSTQSSGAYEEALTAALEQARSKAELLAAASGAKLGKVEAISEDSSNASYYAARDMKANGVEEAATDITPEGLSFSASVMVTYELID